MVRRVMIGLVLCLGLLWSTPALAQQELTTDKIYLGTPTLSSGSGSPEGVVTAPVGSMWFRTDQGMFYVKVSGTSNLGWTQIVAITGVASGSVLASNGVGANPYYTDSPSLTSIGGAGSLTLEPTGDIVLDPSGADIFPGTNFRNNLGSQGNKFLSLHVGQLFATTLVAEDVMSTIGGRILVGPTTKLTRDAAGVDTTIYVEHNEMASGDRVALQTAPGGVSQIEFMAVTSGPTLTGDGDYSYTVTRNLDLTVADYWYAGDAVFNTGTINDGYIDLTSSVGLLSGTGPTIVGNVRTGTTYSAVAPRWAVGNLNGLFGIGTTTHGFAAGDGDHTRIIVDATDGIRMVGDAGTMFEMDAGGSATFSGSLTVGTGRNMLSNTEFARGRGTGDRYNNFWGGSGTNLSEGYNCNAAGCTQQNGIWVGVDASVSMNMNFGIHTGNDWRPVGGGSMYMAVVGTPANGSWTRIWGPVVPVQEGERYEYSVYLGQHRVGDASSYSRVYVVWYGEDGADVGTNPDYVTESAGDTVVSCAGNSAAGGQNLDAWCRASAFFTVPANARAAALTIFTSYNNATADPYVFITRPYFGQAGVAQVTPTPYAAGGVTTISGDMLSTDIVMANTLRSGVVTSATLGTGFWIDASTSTPTFRIGEAVSPGNDYLYWNGTILDIGGKITSSSGDIGGWQLASGYLCSDVGCDNAYSSGLAAVIGTGGAATASEVVIWAGDTYANRNSAEFRVYSSGSVSLGEIFSDLKPSSDGLFSIGTGTSTSWWKGWIEELYPDIIDFQDGGCLGACAGGGIAGYINVKYQGANFKIAIYTY